MQDVFTGAEVIVAFEDEDRPGYFAVINADMELAELGWTKYPKLMHLGWAAQWLQYEARLKANLTQPALEVSIFKEQARLPVLYHPPQASRKCRRLFASVLAQSQQRGDPSIPCLTHQRRVPIDCIKGALQFWHVWHKSHLSLCINELLAFLRAPGMVLSIAPILRSLQLP